MKRIACLLFVLIFSSALCATSQTASIDLAGTWQGTLHVGPGLRTVVKVSPDGNGGWKGELYSIDQTPSPLPLTSIALAGSEFAFTLDALNVKYRGTLDAAGNSIHGALTQGGETPLDLVRATPETEWKIDASPHKVAFVEVNPGVKLEILDWGGTGRPIILLAGLGGTAHVFDTIAPKLAAHYRVFGITRRGFGASSSPDPTEANYSAQQLGDDVLAVLHQLKLDHPIVAGHSIAGEELSDIGTRHPDQVAGLVYLDAGYPYACYSTESGDLTLDANELRHALDRAVGPMSKTDGAKLIQQLLEASLPRLAKDLESQKAKLAAMPDMPTPPDSPSARIAMSVIRGEEKFDALQSPTLAIFASPHDFGPPIPGMSAAERAAAEAMDTESTSAQIDAFRKTNPSARVVVLAHASHGVFVSNEADVLREIDAFVTTLK